jgi:chemotaxis protein methyltransferase CheR
MTILEAMASKRFSLKNVKILGTDIDTEMVKKANAGIYSSTDVANVPDVYKKYFTKIKENTFSINQPLRDIITFKQLNLLSEWPFQGLFDAVFCRNVVIYFDKETQRVLFDKIANILKPNGWLYIGHSESLFKVSDRFELIGQTIYRKVY